MSVKFPATVKGPANAAAPVTVSDWPDAMVTASVLCKLATVKTPLTVTSGLNDGPLSMITTSAAPGTKPVLQLAAVLKLPLESVFQTFTPVNVKPRCRKAFLLSTPCT